MPTPNLGITHIPTATQKVPTANAAFDDFDNATQREIEIAITGNRVLTATEYTRNATFKLTGTPGSAFNLEAPDGDRVFGVWNTTDAVATVKATSAGTTVTVAVGGKALIRADAADMDRFGSGAGVMHEYLPAAAFSPTVTLGCGALTKVETTSGRPDMVGLPFDNVLEERAQMHFVFPKRWNLGILLYQIEYAHVGGQTAGLDGVVWIVDGIAVASAGSIDVAYGTAVQVDADLSAANTLHRPPLSAPVTVAGAPAQGETTFLRVRREVGDVLDDLNIDAIFLGMRLIWVANSTVDD